MLPLAVAPTELVLEQKLEEKGLPDLMGMFHIHGGLSQYL